MEWTGQSLGLDLVQEYLWSRGHGQGTTVATRSIFTSALSEMNFQHRHHDMLYLIYYIITANDRDRSPVTGDCDTLCRYPSNKFFEAYSLWSSFVYITD